MTKIRPFAFVLMPFDKQFDDIYQYGIKQTCDELDIVAERVDEQIFTETILERIYRQIENADFIIADMTGRNPNVFYEVGYAHAKNKLCALLTATSEDIPFDLKQHSHIIYGGKIAELRKQLKPRLDWMNGELERKKKEIISVSLKATSPSLEKTDFSHRGKFDLQVFLRNVSSQRSPEIDAIFITASKAWTLSSNGQECAFELTPDKLRKFLIPPRNSRLAPNAFGHTQVTFERSFWNKFTGVESQDSYKATGDLLVEVVTSEGTIPFKFPLDVEFDEIPF